MGRTEGHSEDLTEGRWVDQTEDHLVDRMGVCSAAWLAARVEWGVERRLLAPV